MGTKRERGRARRGVAAGDRERVLLGKRIKELRAQRGFSQEGLAERMQGNVTYLSGVERGRENPTLDYFVGLAAALDVELVDLFNYPWTAMSDREVKRKLRKLVDSADSDSLRELLAAIASRQL